MNGHYWIGVDFDGTLAEHSPEKFPEPGPPIAPMVERVKSMLDRGYDVRIVTARAGNPPMPQYVTPVVEWCITHLGEPLPVVACKDFQMLELWDDRAHRVGAGGITIVPFEDEIDSLILAMSMKMSEDQIRNQLRKWWREMLRWPHPLLDNRKEVR